MACTSCPFVMAGMLCAASECHPQPISAHRMAVEWTLFAVLPHASRLLGMRIQGALRPARVAVAARGTYPNYCGAQRLFCYVLLVASCPNVLSGSLMGPLRR
jgi:hypothetical protein